MSTAAAMSLVGSTNNNAELVKLPKMIRYSQVVKRAFEWLWPDRIALGKLTFLVGEPGLGKGLLAVDLAARVSRGACWPGEPETRAPLGTAIVLHAEDDPNDTVPERLEAAGADLDKIITFEMEANAEDSQIPRPFSLRDDLGALEAALAATPDCRLVVIDPISAYLGRVDGNHNHEVRSLLHALAELARIYRVAIVVVAHLNKRSSARSIHRVMGALSFVSAARTVWGVMRDPADSDQRLMLTVKSNVSEDNQGLRFRLPKPEGQRVPRVEWDTQLVPMSFDAACGPILRFNNAEQKYRDAENHVTVRLREELSSGPQTRRWLNLMLPGTEEQQYRAADRLGVIKAREAYGWSWMLPEHFPEWQRKVEKEQREQKRERRNRKKMEARKRRAAKREAHQNDTAADIEALRDRATTQVERSELAPTQEFQQQTASSDDADNESEVSKQTDSLTTAPIPGIPPGRATERVHRQMQTLINKVAARCQNKGATAQQVASSSGTPVATDPEVERRFEVNMRKFLKSLQPQEREIVGWAAATLRSGLKQKFAELGKSTGEKEQGAHNSAPGME